MSLDDAWKAAEAALPEGWLIAVGSTHLSEFRPPRVVYWAEAGPMAPDGGPEGDAGMMNGGADTPTAALLALADRLTGATE